MKREDEEGTRRGGKRTEEKESGGRRVRGHHETIDGSVCWKWMYVRACILSQSSFDKASTPEKPPKTTRPWLKEK